ncbi:Rpn family recombination-promoting nuclease/putative transposase [uncultured Rhodospira sp.]|uniref:Rpn family recombination-promoting nuclease/putative transposase n=1 Tax=uncultured Rhodospira sp. TaxID=1936189 RepID=UPI0026384AD2|nr:Rpn family recombination-promoting nuclease/putative transposase [uncultured Rhodospira sp.]
MADHDSLYHRLFSHPLMVEHLVRDAVPDAMAAGVDFARMERVVAKFHDRAGQRRDGDVIWRLPTREGVDVYLYLLLEFQSRNDWWMAVRAQVYEGLLWQHLIAERSLKAGDPLPPVLLVVLHNGTDRWSAPTDTADLVGLPAESPLWPWQPRIRYHVIDMGRLPGDDLARRDTLTALLFRLEQQPDPDELAALVDEVVGWFRRHPAVQDLMRLFAELVRQALAGIEPRVAMPDDLLEARTMLATLGQDWKRRWRAEGKAEGKAETLIRMAERRFGPLSSALRARVLSADEASLDAWIDRLLDGADLDTVFGLH